MSAARGAYTVTASWLHWATAVPLIGSVGSVLKAQQAPKAEKGTWMFRHKSLGLLTAMIVAPRAAYRLINMASYRIRRVPGTDEFEHKAASITHYALYAFMTVMPATGVAMGYYGGKGLPFFWTTIPGAAEKNGNIAKQSFNIHKTMGVYGKYLIPLHVAGAFQHVVRGHAIFPRINPFRGPPKM